MKRRCQSGLTLVEITVVLAIVALLALASYTLLGNALQVMTSKGASEQVAGAIRQARQFAITRGGNYCIEFSAAPSTSYRIRTASDVACTGSSGADNIDWTVIGNGAAVTSPNPAPTVIFDPIGNVKATVPASTPPVSFGVDTQPASCLSTITVTIYGGVRVSHC